MEHLLLLGFVAFAALVGFGLTGYLQQRRAGSIVAVSSPLRRRPRAARRETAAHR